MKNASITSTHIVEQTLKKVASLPCQESYARTLLRYYRNAGGNPEVVPSLEAFLCCTVRFLHQNCKPSEFTLLSMEKLAEAVQKNRETNKSPFDIIMGDVRYTELPAYKALSDLYDIWMARELVKALHAIRDYLYEKHGLCHVLFSIPKKQR